MWIEENQVVFRKALWAVCAVTVATSCGAQAGDNTTPNSDAIEGSIVVFAAASLTDVFSEISASFEDEFPNIDVQLNVAGSSTLREQILGGAPGDVFASADERNMNVVDSAGEVESTPRIFATNTLQIAVPASNPGEVTGLADLTDPDLLVGICAVGVPCGDFAREALDAAGVEASIDTNEGDVRALLTRIEADELDAGIVYVTDVESSIGVLGVEIPDDVNVVVQYPIAVLSASENAAVAEAFTDYVLSPEGQEIIVAAGFGVP